MRKTIKESKPLLLFDFKLPSRIKKPVKTPTWMSVGSREMIIKYKCVFTIEGINQK